MSNFRQKNEPSSKFLKQKCLNWIRYLCYKSVFFSSFLSFSHSVSLLQISKFLPISKRDVLNYSLKAAVPSNF